MKARAGISRALVIAFALAFLLETWIWGGMVAAVRIVGALIPWTRLKAAIQRNVNRLPAPAALILFLVPLAVNEFGSLGCIFLIATGHVVTGVAGYILLKIVGLSLIAVIFDLTRDKLMTLPWFVVAYVKFAAFHDFALRLVAPYRDAALARVNELRERALDYGRRLGVRLRRQLGAL